MLFSIEREQLAFALDQGLQMNGAGPDGEQILQRIFGVINSKVNPFVTMVQIKFASIFVVRLSHKDERLPKIRQGKEELLLHCPKVPVRNDVSSLIRIVSIDK